MLKTPVCVAFGRASCGRDRSRRNQAAVSGCACGKENEVIGNPPRDTEGSDSDSVQSPSGRGESAARPLRIAIISFYVPSGSKIGVGYQAHHMANAMVKRGHQVTMFSPNEASEGALYANRIVPVGAFLRTFRFPWNVRSFDFSEFDVVHAHGDIYGRPGPGRPIFVRTMHGSCFAEATKIRGAKQKLRMLMLTANEWLAIFLADRTVCVSENTRRYFPGLKHVIMNGVDTAAFRPCDEKESRPTVLFVGTYERRKRGRLVMEAFQRDILPIIPDAQLWMVCEDAPEAPNVTHFVRIPTEELANLYRRAWVFCLPSTYEGFGVPYIEAMASGTPVVATPNPGSVEVLGGGKFGILTGADTLGRELLRVLQEEGHRSELARIGLERSREFDWNHIMSQYESIYAEIAAGRGGLRAPTSR
jgi:glycosyltransferase involved in cell wall biosynthesis